MVGPEEIEMPERIVYPVQWDDGTVDLFSLSKANADRLRKRAQAEGMSEGELLNRIFMSPPAEELSREESVRRLRKDEHPDKGEGRTIRGEILVFGLSGFLLLGCLYDYFQ